MSHPCTKVSIRSLVVRCAVIVAALAGLLAAAPTSADAATSRCYRHAEQRGYDAVFVVIGRPCASRIVYRCRGFDRQRQRLVSLRPITVATVECPYPVAFARIRPARMWR